MNPRLCGITLTAASLLTAVAVSAPAVAQTDAPAAAAQAGADRTPALRAAAASSDQVRSQLGLSSAEALVPRSVVTDPDGTTHTRYDRTYQGLRVVGGDLVVERSAAGSIRSTIKNATGKIAVASLTPTVTRSDALAVGDARAKAATGEKSAGELVVYAGEGTPRLAYDVVTTGTKADQTPTRLHTLVDARTGATLTSWDEIVHGTGNSQYSGQVSIGTTAGSGGYTLRDATGNVTTDLNGGTSGTGTTVTDADDVWGNGSTSSRQTAAVDAHFGAEKTFEYYQGQLGRNGIWDDGRGARSRVHYGNAYVNAFWDGTQMTYGDGAGNARPLTQLDVAAHEMSHGVTENSAGLVYSGDAGGLNEATSDIFGTAVEWYANTAADVPDYLLGEKINIRGNGTPLRYMDRPSKDGSSYDCWSSAVSGADPHYSSGPLNHWYYMLSEGSGAKTINGVSYSSATCGGAPAVTGIGHVKAEKIWYRTLATKLTSNSTYRNAREGAIRSAIELYGASSAECAATVRAFDAITVPAGSATCTGGTDPNPPTTGNLLANPGFESGATAWTGSSGPITSNSGRPARTGSWKLWLGGNGTATTETLGQGVTVPASATAPKLSYYLRTDTSDSTSRVYDTMRVQVVAGGTTRTVATYTNVGTSSTYALKSHDLAAYKGQTITVRFTATEDSGGQTSWVVDDTALTTS